MKNRRKYDSANTHDLISMVHDRLEAHEVHDIERFGKLFNKVDLTTKMVAGLYAALALFGFLLEHPKIISNLTAGDANASVVAEINK